jgi:hypothetical protein
LTPLGGGGVPWVEGQNTMDKGVKMISTSRSTYPAILK